MKARSVLLFIVLCIFSLGAIGFFFPQEGIYFISKLQFLNPSQFFIQDTTGKKELSINDIINNSYKNFQKGKIMKIEDSLQQYIEFSKSSPSAICYPNNKISYFDNFFLSIDSSKIQNKVIRIMHYGDSQIESDRISGYLRQELQEKFGGNGFGLIPAVQTIPSLTVSQTWIGNLQRYAIWSFGEEKAPHRRYGLMAQVVKVNGSGNIYIYANKQAYERAKEFSKVSLIFGKNTGTFKAQLIADDEIISEEVVNKPVDIVKVFTWNLPIDAKKARIQIKGTAEIYGIALDGESGVTVDNNPMRGASGTFFSRIDSLLMTRCYKEMNVGMIIMQFGGNMMPVLSSMEILENYTKSIAKELQYFKKVNPNAVLLYIGPSDMSRNIGGKMKTWRYLKELNTELKKVVLENGAAYWDMFEAMGGENSMPKWVKSTPPLAATDYVHFSSKGAKKISEMLFFALMNDYNAYKLRNKIEIIKKDSIFRKISSL